VVIGQREMSKKDSGMGRLQVPKPSGQSPHTVTNAKGFCQHDVHLPQTKPIANMAREKQRKTRRSITTCSKECR
jgi:hypothetical protein